MIIQIWEVCFILIILLFTILGTVKGFLRTLTLLSAHLFSCALSLVFSPALTELFNRYMNWDLTTHFPSFTLVYLFPMILLTQLFRVMYKRNIQKNGRQITFSGRMGGFVTGLILAAFFCLLFTWILLLQPLISVESIYSMGGVVFNQSAHLLQYFMRFYV